MFEFELSDNADAVVRVIIAIGKLIIFVFVICMLWEFRTPPVRLYTKENGAKSRSEVDKSVIDYGQFQNSFWKAGPDSTREFGTYLPGDKTSCGSDPLDGLAQDDGLSAARRKGSPDGL